ncbi:hypothetical protein ACIQ34_03630 [Ureibacillus sp. NPDC094379]
MQITRSMNRLDFGERKRIRKETEEAYNKTKQYTLANKSEVINALITFITGGTDGGINQAIESKKDHNYSTLATLNQIQETKLETASDEFLGDDGPFEFSRFGMDGQGLNRFYLEANRPSIFAQTDFRIYNEAISKYCFQIELANNGLEVNGPRYTYSI